MAQCDDCGQEMLEGRSCTLSVIQLAGREYPRIFYGAEPMDWGAKRGGPCGDCGVRPGGFHHLGCDIEHCPRCSGQLIMCPCTAAAWEAL